MRTRRLYAIIGLVLLGVMVVTALMADQWAPYSPFFRDPQKIDFSSGTPQIASPPFPPGGYHPLGTDTLGRDVASMLVYGTRYTLLLGLAILTLRFLLAVPAAFSALYWPKLAFPALRRLYMLTSAVPPLVFYILFLRIPGLTGLSDRQALLLNLSILTVFEWPRLALNLHGWLDKFSHSPFVEGAIAIGCSRGQILRRHLFPHLVPLLCSLMAAEMGRVLLLAGQLGIFGVYLGGGMIVLGEGVNSPPMLVNRMPEWGAMLAEARGSIYRAPWALLTPAIALFLAILAFHLLAQGVAEFYDAVGARLRVWLDQIQTWRKWAVASAIAVLSLLVYFQGFPWGNADQILQAADERLLTLKAADREGFLAALDSGAPSTYRTEQAHWFDAVWASRPTQVTGELKNLKLAPTRATATQVYSFTLPDGREVKAERQVAFRKRWGTWREISVGFDSYRSLQGRITSPLKIDARHGDQQGMANYLGALVDETHSRLNGKLPGGLGEELFALTVYPSRVALQAAGDPLDSGKPYHRWVGGESLQLAAELLNDRAVKETMDLKVIVQDAMLHQLVWEQTGGRPAPLLEQGLINLFRQLGGKMTVHLPSLKGRELYPLPDLAAQAAAGPSEADWAYRIQSGLFAQQLLDGHGGAAIIRALQKIRQGQSELEAVASATGQTVNQLAEGYASYVVQQITDQSELKVADRASKLPKQLIDLIESQGARFLQAELSPADQPTGAVVLVYQPAGTAGLGQVNSRRFRLEAGMWVSQ